MKATGIVRRIDELGRIVIPKEIRRTYRIKEGTSLEIFIDENGELILKKYSALQDIHDIAIDISSSLNSVLNCLVLVTDTDKVIAGTGNMRGQFIDKLISNQLDDFLSKRKFEILHNSLNNTIKIADEAEKFSSILIAPVICGGDIFGSIILLSFEMNFTASEMNVVKTMCEFLSHQL